MKETMKRMMCFLRLLQLRGSLGSSLGCGMRRVWPSLATLTFSPDSASTTYPSVSRYSWSLRACEGVWRSFSPSMTSGLKPSVVDIVVGVVCTLLDWRCCLRREGTWHGSNRRDRGRSLSVTVTPGNRYIIRRSHSFRETPTRRGSQVYISFEPRSHSAGERDSGPKEERRHDCSVPRARKACILIFISASHRPPTTPQAPDIDRGW